MSSNIARCVVGMAVAAAIALFDVGAIGSAAAQSSAMLFAPPEDLINRFDSPVSETDARRADHQHAGWIAQRR